MPTNRPRPQYTEELLSQISSRQQALQESLQQRGGVREGLVTPLTRDMWVSSQVRTAAQQYGALYTSMDEVLYPRPPKKPSASLLTKKLSEEKKWVEEFIKTRRSNYAYTLEGGIIVRGHKINDLQTLFKIQGRVITANKTRAKHIKPLLTKLAERENLELRLTDARVSATSEQILSQITFYAWDNAEELDDTSLLKATIRLDNPHEDYCGDDECDVCYPEDEEDEDQDW